MNGKKSENYTFIHLWATLLQLDAFNSPRQLIVNTNLPNIWQQLSPNGEDKILKYKPSIRIGKTGDLGGFELSKVDDLQGFSGIATSQVCRESSTTGKISKELEAV